jgi:hypothetical protein
MKRFALVLVAVSMTVATHAGDRPEPFIQALLRVPVGAAIEQPAADGRKAPTGEEPLTGDERTDRLSMLASARSPLITPAVRERIVARLAAEPELLPDLIELLPDTEAAAAAAWAAYQKLPPTAPRAEGESGAVRLWLRRHGEHLRDELAEAARQTKDDDGWVRGEEDLTAYARLDWNAAQPMVRSFAAGPAPRTAALAHALLYAHAVADNPAAAGPERAALQAIADDRAAPARARDIAFEALIRSEWEGRTEWYLARFADPTLVEARDGSYGLSPLGSAVDDDPDLWIPRVAPLTRSEDRVIRSNAAAILSGFQLDTARADALKPLLPWLADPAWAEDVGMGRLRLVQSVGRLDLREAIPGLRWICDNDPDDGMRAYAADALLELHAPNAMADVRTVLSKSEDAMGRGELEQRIVSSGVLTDDDIVEALTAYATALTTDEGRKQLQSFSEMPWKMSVGARLASRLPDRDTLAQRLFVAAAGTDEAAKILGRIVSTIDVPPVHRWLAARLLEVTPSGDDAFPIVSLLQHRQGAARSAGKELQAALEKGGIAKGIAAVVLNDTASISAILRTGTAAERDAALAAARIVRQPLETAEILQAAANAKETAAAELEMMNTAAARAALARLYPSQARIWGPRPWEDPGHTTFSFFDEWEETLRTLQKQRKFDRIDALASASYWGSNGEIVILARTGDAMQLISTTHGTKSTPVPPATASRIRQLLDDTHPVDLEPFDEGTADGIQYEYVYLTPDGGRRVFMNNPSFDQRDPYARVVAALSGLVAK